MYNVKFENRTVLVETMEAVIEYTNYLISCGIVFTVERIAQ
jgi:hypothetical protein